MAFPLKALRSAHDARRLLWSAIDTGDVDKLDEILADRSLANGINAHGVTPLLHAVCQNRAQIVRTLIEHGADVNAARADGFTPLLLATFFGYTDIVQVLVLQGANLGATTRFGTSAKMWAMARGFHDIAEYLQQWQDNRGRLGLVAAPPIADDSVNKSSGSDVSSAKPDVDIKPDDSWFSEENASRPMPANHSTATTAGNREVAELSIEPPVVRRLKEPPDIWDLVHENPSNFNPGSALVSRIISAKARAMVFILAVMLILATFTYVGLRLRNQSKHSTVTELTTPSVPPLVPPSSESSVKEAEVNKESTLPEQTPIVSAPIASSVVEVKSKELSEKKFVPTEYKSSKDTYSLNGSSQPIARSPSKISQPPNEQVNKLSQTDADPVVKSPTTQKQAVESSSNDNTRVRDEAPPTKKPSNLGTNSPVITRPFGTSTTKPKVIQWP